MPGPSPEPVAKPTSESGTTGGAVRGSNTPPRTSADKRRLREDDFEAGEQRLSAADPAESPPRAKLLSTFHGLPQAGRKLCATIYFPDASSALDPYALDILGSVVGGLAEGGAVELDGYASVTGDQDDNVELSLARVRAVASVLSHEAAMADHAEPPAFSERAHGPVGTRRDQARSRRVDVWVVARVRPREAEEESTSPRRGPEKPLSAAERKQYQEIKRQERELAREMAREARLLETYRQSAAQEGSRKYKQDDPVIESALEVGDNLQKLDAKTPGLNRAIKFSNMREFEEAADEQEAVFTKARTAWRRKAAELEQHRAHRSAR